MHQIQQILKHATRENPTGVATIDMKCERERCWSEISDRVQKLAGALQGQGVQEGDRVAVLSQNRDTYLEYYFAVIRAGGIFVPLNVRLSSHEISQLLRDCSPAILVVDDHSYTKVQESTKKIDTIFIGEGDLPEGLLDHESFLQCGRRINEINRSGEDIAMIIYTGGTAGQPKGVMLTHKNIIQNSRSALALLNDEKHWRYLHAAPMYHIADCQWNAGVTMLAGTHLFIETFDPELLLSMTDRYKITHTAMVPTMLKMLCEVSNVNSYDLSSLRKINIGGSPISAELIAAMRETLPHCELVQGYGLTETSPNISMLPDRYHAPGNPKMTSVGKPVPGIRVKITDIKGIQLPKGTVGEIITKGAHVMAGYWNNPEATDKAIQNGWLRTGDLGYMDEDGFVFIVDRLKDMIITGGENVYSTEVESVIQQFENVDSCAVIAVPDELWGESVYAIVVPKQHEMITEKEIITHCKRYLADFKCPKYIEIRRESLPMSGPGKILKRKLRSPFWPEEGREIH